MQDVVVQREEAALVESRTAGTEVSGEFRCAECGYGAVLRGALPLCPMCGAKTWESQAPRRVD